MAVRNLVVLGALWAGIAGCGGGKQANLSVQLTGDGTGSVFDADLGIQCSANCDTPLSTGQHVVLSVTPTGSSIFGGWGGACGGSGACDFVLERDTTVSARFELPGVAYPVSVTLAGKGGGSVADSNGNHGCSAGTCTFNGAGGGNITLIAVPDVDSTFTGWSGACTGTSTSCTFALEAATQVTATFTPLPRHTLTVDLTGLGGGTVASAPSGISGCGAPTGKCSTTFADGRTVVLTAVPDSLSAVQFSGCDSTGVDGAGHPTCTLAMTANRSVTVGFNRNAILSVDLTNSTGQGTVAAAPISCTTDGTTVSGDCSDFFTPGSTVHLVATPAANTSVTWTGCVTSTATTCDVTMSTDVDVTATFTSTAKLTVAITGTGTVTSTPSGINCSSGSCNASFPVGTAVHLVATPGANTTVTWGGACTGTGTTCDVTLSTAKNVTATFSATTTNLTVAITGTGSGTVTSSPAGISCSSGSCSAAFATGASVTLTAAPAADSNVGWSGGGCSGNGTTCTVTVSSAQTVTITFTQRFLLTAVAPANGATGVDPAAVLDLTFNQAVDPTTLAGPAADGPCSGFTVQLSTDNTFTNCLGLGSAAQVTTKEYTLAPSAPLTSGATYYLQVTTGVKNTSGTALFSAPPSSSFTVQ